MKKKKKGGKIKKVLLGIFAFILAAIIIVFAICMIPVRTQKIDPAIFKSDSEITVSQEGKYTFFVPENPSAGLIFYQGARVDAKAYAPLMRELARRNILTVLIDSPFNLAFFAMNAPDGIQEKFPQVHSWYIGGHSMGAEVAGEYLIKHTDDYIGLALFAGFVTNDFSSTDLSAISIYGENDGVLTGGAYDECLSHLPEDFNELVIKGGNHSGFAYYGPQKGDNEATITKDEQIKAAADFFAEKVNESVFVPIK